MQVIIDRNNLCALPRPWSSDDKGQVDNGMLQARGNICQLGFITVRNILSHMIVLHAQSDWTK